jgi:hypothetical protein
VVEALREHARPGEGAGGTMSTRQLIVVIGVVHVVHAMLPRPAWADDEDDRREAKRARALAPLLRITDLEDDTTKQIVWSFDSQHVSKGTQVVLGVKNRVEPDDDDTDIETPRVVLGLVQGGKKLLASWSGRGWKAYKALGPKYKERLKGCNRGVLGSLKVIGLGGSQHVQVEINCLYGEDCSGAWTATRGEPTSLRLAWLGPGGGAETLGNCVESECHAEETVSFELSRDGRTLLIKRSKEISFLGEKSDAKKRRACKPHPPRARGTRAVYRLPRGGLPISEPSPPPSPK